MLRRVCADETENPFTAVTEKMTQTFTMAFTAKCAECGVCERSTACNSSGLFCILYKASASPCFLHCCSQNVSEERCKEDSNLKEKKKRFLFKPHLALAACGYSHASTSCSWYISGVSVDSSNMGHCRSEVSIGRQLTNKAHANSGQSRP